MLLRLPHLPHSFAYGLCALAALAVSVTPSSGATIAYGAFGPVPPGVEFDDVEETSITDAVPLYGPPDLFAVGLDFDPAGFGAAGVAGAADGTLGQLNFSILTDPNVGITEITVFEAGDYSLLGSGTAATDVSAGVILRVTVTQLNGVNIAPANLVPVNASLAFNLVANPGVALPWSLGAGLNVEAQVAGIFGPGNLATGLDVSIDNVLTAVSEGGAAGPSTVAIINKTEFQVSADSLVIPEPATGCLLLSVLGALCWVRRRS